MSQNEVKNGNVSESLVKNVVITKDGKIISENISKEVKKSAAKKNAKRDNLKKETEKVSGNVLQNVLSQMQNKSMLSTAKGMRKENIYRKEVFAECITDREKKSTRRKIRNLLESFVSSLLRAKSEQSKKAIAKDFCIFYKEIYSLNDFSIDSLISNNTDETKKDNVQKFLNLVKKYK